MLILADSFTTLLPILSIGAEFFGIMATDPGFSKEEQR
jgi:hypothetical protein